MIPKNTTQKSTILRILDEKATHLTADEIYKESKKSIPNISLGTIYRNLKQLKEFNKIIEIRFSDKAKYEKPTKPHHHSVCRKCGEIQNVFSNEINKATKKVEPQDFIIEDVSTTFVGLCRFCKQFS
jgi:Fur family transcriptional regulator, peroxide stress response regulator